MECKKACKYIGEYAEGCLDAKTAGEIEAHLASCRACAAEMSSYEKLVNAAVSVKYGDPGAKFWQDYLPKLREKLSVKPPWYDFLRRPLAASVSLALLLLMVLAPLAAGRIGRIVKVRKAGAITEETVVKRINSNPEWLAAAIEEYQLLSDASNVAEILSLEEKDRLVAEMTADLMD